jgi:transposase InsO family protein
VGGTRGGKITLAERQQVLALLEEACASGARLSQVCEVVGLSVRTVQRWREDGELKADGRQAAAQVPANKLSAAERQQILEVVNQPAFRSLPPSQIVPALADQGIYLASESSFYRVLREAKQLQPRGRANRPTHHHPPAYSASGPNQVWSWDITYLATTVTGRFFYLYLILDIYSRKIVGWEVFEAESAEHAATVFQKAYLREQIQGDVLVLHADNGGPMKGATMLATLQKLGVVPSFSRPAVSDDNPYSEALFKTVKYHPAFPSKPFEMLQEAREWVLGFQRWYNEQHKHSGLKFLTPAQRHSGADAAIMTGRKAVYEAAKRRHPARWSGATRNWELPQVVWLNPSKAADTEEEVNTQTET